MSIAEVKPRTLPALGPESNGMSMTPDEFDGVTEWDDVFRYELIHGVVIVNPIPSEAEGDPNEHLGYTLRLYQQSHPQGKVLDKTLPERYVRTKDSRRRADRVIWAGLGRVPDPKVDVPAIVVEFVSRRRRDRIRDYLEKRNDYATIGVAEYWIIDRFGRKMTVFRRDGVEQVIDESETYVTPLLPGFSLPLAELLAVADDWSDQE
jgi:Uma2 family endonuclease